MDSITAPVLHCPECHLGILKPLRVTLEEFIRDMEERGFVCPPYHRKKRIQKKWYKKYIQLNTGYWMMALVMVNNPPVFSCNMCGRRCGYLEAVGSNILQVENLVHLAGLT